LKKILITTLIVVLFVSIGAFGYFYYQSNNTKGNLQYVETETGEQILMPKTWTFTTGKEVGNVLNIKNNKNIKTVFFATENQNNSKVFYYVIKEKLNGKISKHTINNILKSTLDSEKKNGVDIKVKDNGVINSQNNNKGQFIIYKVGNINKFIAYFYDNDNELITFTSYLNEEVYEQKIPLIKYIALKNKY